jgi:hypothetical protein
MSEGERSGSAGHWRASYESAREDRLELTSAATPLQRLEWLEEMLEIAYRAGALQATREEARD